MFPSDMFLESTFETLEEQLQRLMNQDAQEWLIKVRRWSNLHASLYANVTWKEHNELWLKPLICVVGDPMLKIGIVIDIFRNVYYISLYGSSSRQWLYRKFKKGFPKWACVYGDWILYPGINDMLLAAAFCFTQVRAETGFMEVLIKCMRCVN